MSKWLPPEKTGRYDVLLARTPEHEYPEEDYHTSSSFTWQVIATDLERNKAAKLVRSLLETPLYAAARLRPRWTEGHWEEENPTADSQPIPEEN